MFASTQLVEIVADCLLLPQDFFQSIKNDDLSCPDNN